MVQEVGKKKGKHRLGPQPVQPHQAADFRRLKQVNMPLFINYLLPSIGGILEVEAHIFLKLLSLKNTALDSTNLRG